MKLLYAAYREWAIDAYRDFVLQPNSGVELKLVGTQKDLLKQLEEFKPDVTFLAGWSWIIPADVCEKHYIVVFHPSDLPAYAGGTPLQHQILDGITQTKATLFRIAPQIDAGNILMKVDLSLEGNMSDIFKNLRSATVQLLVNLVERWPNVEEIPQGHVVPRRRIKPEESRLTAEHLTRLTARELYDFIRCREDPYPNAYVEDETGRLLIKLVKFEPR